MIFIEPDIGDSCDDKIDCLHRHANSDCVDDKCRCKDDERVKYLNGQGYCYKSEAGEPCQSNQDCLSE